MDLLRKDGLSLEVLEKLSYRSQLGLSLKKNLHYFDKDVLLDEIRTVLMNYNGNEFLHTLIIDYRVKSIQSAKFKYERYYPAKQVRQVFNDLLGFRSFCDNYDEVLSLQSINHIRIVDMSNGKANDDGYHGVYLYFQLDNFHYPIEIQYNTYYDRQFNNWLHNYVYKQGYDNHLGCILRNRYENGKIITEKDFKEELKHVLLSREKNE